MAKNCGHNQVCVECTRAEIAQFEAKISALRAQLPSVICNGYGCFGHYRQHIQAVPMPFYNGLTNLNGANTVLCSAQAGLTAGGSSNLTALTAMNLTSGGGGGSSNLGLPSGNSNQYGGAQ